MPITPKGPEFVFSGLTSHIGAQYSFALADIPRWSGKSTIAKESVAEHSFGVARIVVGMLDALDTTSLWFSPLMKVQALKYAINHDLDEEVTGDIPHDSKKAFPVLRAISYQVCGTTQQSHHPPEVLFVVKLADLIHAHYFLLREYNMGNKLVEGTILVSWGEIRDHISKYAAHSPLGMHFYDKFKYFDVLVS